MELQLVATIAPCPRCVEILFADDVDGRFVSCPGCGLDVDEACLDWRRSDSVWDVQP